MAKLKSHHHFSVHNFERIRVYSDRLWQQTKWHNLNEGFAGVLQGYKYTYVFSRYMWLTRMRHPLLRIVPGIYPTLSEGGQCVARSYPPSRKALAEITPTLEANPPSSNATLHAPPDYAAQHPQLASLMLGRRIAINNTMQTRSTAPDAAHARASRRLPMARQRDREEYPERFREYSPAAKLTLILCPRIDGFRASAMHVAVTKRVRHALDPHTTTTQRWRSIRYEIRLALDFGKTARKRGIVGIEIW
ncbi:hypothetical protein K438DRAFT_1759290 [Mycena galopus ATCC 62051]|nr:hypothetical protein K438DRAFT_1759290 [Mycena galopus ATCC 62051]